MNRLAANDDKTHILVVRSVKEKEPVKLTFQVGNQQIEERAHEKLLGIWVANDLSGPTTYQSWRKNSTTGSSP